MSDGKSKRGDCVQPRPFAKLVSKTQFRALAFITFLGACILITSQLMAFYRQQVKIQHEGSADGDSFWIEEVLEEPRIFVLHKLLSAAETEELRSLGVSKGMEIERTVPAVKFVDGNVGTERSHLAATVERGETALVRLIEERLSNLTKTTVSQGEPFQILHYRANKDDYFRQHRDYLEKDEITDLQDGGNRLITVILYLRTPTKGGETFFNQISHKMHVDPGDAILVWNVKKDGSNEPLSAHSGLPPTQGDKWVAVKWIRAKPIERHANTTRPKLKFKKQKVSSVE